MEPIPQQTEKTHVSKQFLQKQQFPTYGQTWVQASPNAQTNRSYVDGLHIIILGLMF